MKKQLTKRVIPLLIFLFVVNICIGQAKLYAGDKKDVILVLDTSLSMKGHGGRNILEKVKKSIAGFIDKKVEDGDRVTFITFDTEIRLHPPMIMDDDNDRDILKKFISMTEAKGQWTYIYKMLKAVIHKAGELEKKDGDRQTVIIVMTDGLDDPPPNQKKSRFNLEKIAQQYNAENWWFYLVDLSEMKKDKKLATVDKKLEAEIKKAIPHSKRIDGSKKDPSEVIEKDLKEDIDRKERKSGNYLLPILIILGVLGCAGGLIVVFKKMSQLKVTGTIEYWNHGVLDPYLESFDLTRYQLKEVIVGKGYECLINLRDIEAKNPFSIVAVKDHKGVKMALKPGEGNTIEYKNREAGQFLEDGDIFEVANYSFKYASDKEGGVKGEKQE
ncbi:MAG: VWA domain-containing protein [bacterium]|nr:VWA domain-containing protein [bacterium]